MGYMTMKIAVLVFWVVTPCGLVGRYQQFGGTCCLHILPLKYWYLCTHPHVITDQKTSIDMWNSYFMPKLSRCRLVLTYFLCRLDMHFKFQWDIGHPEIFTMLINFISSKFPTCISAVDMLHWH
jgi:hypothetical protein